jgi:hypothetical protein
MPEWARLARAATSRDVWQRSAPAKWVRFAPRIESAGDALGAPVYVCGGLRLMQATRCAEALDGLLHRSGRIGRYPCLKAAKVQFG